MNLCKKHRVPIVINTDAHFCGIIGNVANAARMVEDLSFPKELILNADMEKVKEFITAKRGDVFGADFEYVIE